jgi:hypothetical protein
VGEKNEPKPVPTNSAPQLPKVPENREIQGETNPPKIRS